MRPGFNGCWTALAKAVGVIYSPGGVGDFLSSSSSSRALDCAFARPAKTRMVQARTIALDNSSNLNMLMLMFKFLSLVKFPHDPAVGRGSDRSMLSERSQQTREHFTLLSLNCSNSARDVGLSLFVVKKYLYKMCATLPHAV